MCMGCALGVLAMPRTRTTDQLQHAIDISDKGSASFLSQKEKKKKEKGIKKKKK